MLTFVTGMALSAGAHGTEAEADDSQRRQALAANLWLWAGFLTGQIPPDGSHSLGQAWLWILSG